MMASEGRDLVLRGLDGSNPLGFLAAIGVLAIASDEESIRVRMGWTEEEAWHPFLHINPDSCTDRLPEILLTGLKATKRTSRGNPDEVKLRDELQEARRRLRSVPKAARKNESTPEKKELLASLQTEVESKREAWLSIRRNLVNSPELALGNTAAVPSEEFRELVMELAGDASPRKRSFIDTITNFGCDACTEKTGGMIRTTPFCFITGSGHQYFLKTANDLMEKVDVGQIRRCLYEAWTYEDEQLSMRWDPTEDRRYALMWKNPSTEKGKTVWAANLLAYRGLRLLASVPMEGRLETTGFVLIEGRQFFTWPIWNAALTSDTVRSVLSIRELRDRNPDRERLSKMGIAEVFRSERMKVGLGSQYKVNFSQAGPV